MAQWLTVVSWVAVILGLLTALAIAFDVAAHPQHMKIMNVAWPITGLYLPIVGWLLYADMARRKPTRDMHTAHGADIVDPGNCSRFQRLPGGAEGIQTSDLRGAGARA